MPAYPEVDEVYEYLDMKNQNLGINELVDIFASLSEDRILKQLDLSYNISKDDCNNHESMELLVSTMIDTLHANKSLTALDFCGNHLGDFWPHPLNNHNLEYIKEVTKALKTSSVRKIDMSDNLLIGETGRVYSGLSDFIHKYVIPCDVHTLKLRANHLHSQAIAIISDALGSYSKLVELDLSDNCCGLDSFGNVNPEGSVGFSKVASQSHALRRLNLSRNNLHDTDIIALSEAFSKMPSLNYLDLNTNNITFIGMEAFKDVLIAHCNLRGRYLCTIYCTNQYSI
jgi:Ran GTPase-activating protein (RanGAP) involved in mRNA processing and transport